jgi:aminoglycoside 2'-N-acetyltransferase I
MIVRPWQEHGEGRATWASTKKEGYTHVVGEPLVGVKRAPDAVGEGRPVGLRGEPTTLRAGYVEGVAVRADHRRRGHAAAMMAALERMLRSAYDLGALSATEEGAAVYAARGWQRWSGPTSALTPTGVRRTIQDDGTVHIVPVTGPLDLTGELTCDWRDGDLW